MRCGNVPSNIRAMKTLMPILLVSLLVAEWVCAHAAAEPPGTTAATGVYSVLDYGARGAGTVDDTAAIQKAVDACAERLTDDYGPALEARHVEDLRLDQFTGQSAHPVRTPDRIVE